MLLNRFVKQMQWCVQCGEVSRLLKRTEMRFIFITEFAEGVIGHMTEAHARSQINANDLE